MIETPKQAEQKQRIKRLLNDIRKAGGVENFVKQAAKKHEAWLKYQEKKDLPANIQTHYAGK